ncbi:MAG: GldG family protein, partial [Treponema sp.]|nr:GldG family protein [Treponema sp.]
MALKNLSKSSKSKSDKAGHSGKSARPISLGPLFGKRNVRYGFVSVCITVVVIAAIVLFNVVLTALFKRYPLDIDLTEDQIFEISEETKDYLRDLNQDVNIYVLNTESAFIATSPTEYFLQANEVIHRYAQYSSRAHLEYIDMIRNPNFASLYPEQDLSIGDILIVSGPRSRKLSPQDLFNIRSSYYGSYVSSSKAEQAMTSALLGVTSTKISLAALVSGHGEEDISSLTELLQMNSWEQVSFNSLTEPVPPDASLVILAAPERDLLPDELSKIDTFLESGNDRVFLYLSSYAQGGQVGDQTGFPNLDAFLAEWGVAVDSGIVFETNNARIIGNSSLLALADFVEGDYTKSVIEQQLYPVIPQSR